MNHIKVYRIFRVSDDGLLKEVESNSYGHIYNTFCNYYETEELALEAINQANYSGDLVIVPGTTRVLSSLS